MSSITPCRDLLSDRFPVASFVVRVPPSRCFEVVCAREPSLLRREEAHRRTPDNFYTSRVSGLLRAPAGEATVLVPPQQLRRFAGTRRLYYALGTYAGPGGEDARFSATGTEAEKVPYVQVASDFTGRALDRSALGSSGSYGAPRAVLTWGGDLASEPDRRRQGYDDGHDPALWSDAQTAGDPEPADPRRPPRAAGFRASAEGAPAAEGYGRREARPEPPGYEDARGLPPAEPPRAYGAAEPPGEEHPPRTEARFGAPRAEPQGFEDAAAARAAGAYGQPGTPAEPPGREDPSDLGEPAYRGSPPPGTAPGQAEEYRPAVAYGRRSAGAELTARERARILRPVFKLNGGVAGYGRVELDDRGQVRWGMAGFSEADGSLQEVLAKALERERSATYGSPASSAFACAFGAAADEAREWARAGGPWRGRPLASPEMRTALARAGALHEPAPTGAGLDIDRDPFKLAQNEVAITRVLGAATRLAPSLGLGTDRGLAVLYDRAADQSPAEAERWFRQALAGCPPEADALGRLRHCADHADRTGAPFARRMRALVEDRTDLHDVAYALGE